MAYYMQGDNFPRGGRRGMRGRGREQQYSARHTSDALDSAVAADPDDVFIVRPPKNYLGSAHVFKHQVLGEYSLDEDKNLRYNQSGLRILDRKYLPTHGQLKVNLDLNAGFAKASRYSGSIEQTFHNFLRWILSKKEVLMTKTTPPRLAADFIGIRNVFSTIMRTQYSRGEFWSIDAVEFNGSIYMTTHTNRKLTSKIQDDLEHKYEVYGYKIKQYISGGDPDDGVKPNKQYRSVVKLVVDQTSLLFAPLHDCVDPGLYKENFKDLSAFVKIKVAKNIHRNNLRQWWIENTLNGIHRTIIGLRNDDGIVHTLKYYEAHELLKDKSEADVCVNFLVQFLTFVKSKMAADTKAEYRFDCGRNGNIYCTELPNSARASLLPSWYTEKIFSKDTGSKCESKRE